MKKNKGSKTKGQGKESGGTSSPAKVVRLKSAKAKRSWTDRLPAIGQWWSLALQFLAEAWQELKKVVWPGRKETLGTTAVVLFLVIVIASFLGLVDMGLSALVKRVVR
jgi:preprotein translocase subunit SecE|uniref:Protein translocase subunit SecE n=1 Tax=Desulfobacca acetoxidans TaxID=60893 RepID=A0A7C5EQ90_9BACT